MQEKDVSFSRKWETQDIFMTQQATSLHTYRALETGWNNEHKEPGAFTWEGKEEYGEQHKMSQPQERCILGYMCGIKSIVH